MFGTFLRSSLIAFLPFLMGQGCGQPVPPARSSTPAEDVTSADAGQPTQSLADMFRVQCGRGRTVRTVPTSTFVETSYRLEMTATPSVSALGRALSFSDRAFDSDERTAHGVGSLMEVDERGLVVYSVGLAEIHGRQYYTRAPSTVWANFIVRDGCLQLDYQMDGEFDPTQYEGGPCGLDKITLTRRGVAAALEPGEEYMCISFDAESHCRECWFADDAWNQHIRYAIDYIAEGSLDGVTVWDSGQPSMVNIRAGDRVRIEGAVDVVYRRSPGPEELGYEEWR